MKNLTFLIKPVSGACNLRCQYCFYAEEMSRRAIPDYGRMSEATLAAIVARAAEEASESVCLIFQGGEPTLAGLDFYKTLLAMERRLNRKKLLFTHSIQTNGIALDDAWAAFFHQEHFLVGLSLDGYHSLHDSLRTDARGEGTHSRVLQAVRLLQQYQVEFNVLCVVTHATAVNAEKIYAYFRNSGFSWLQFIPCLDPPEKSAPPWSLTAADYAAFLRKTYALYMNDLRHGKKISIRNFDNYRRMLMGGEPESCDMAGCCTASLVVEADGSVFPCDFYATDQWKMGNIRTDTIAALQSSEAARRFVESSRVVEEACKQCAYFALCRGGCRRNREPFPTRNRFCDAYYALGEELVRNIAGEVPLR